MKSHYLPRLLLVFLFLTLPAWSQSIVSCNSDDMNYHTCEIGPNRGVTVVRQHSEAQCIQGQTYGVRGTQLWVDRGCRADFQVNTRGGWNQGGVASALTCSSDDMRRHYCALPTRGRVQMVHQHSEAQCIQGQTWGVQGNQLWVDRGCRADFQVLQWDRERHRDWDDDRDHDRDRDDRDRDHDRDRDYDRGRDHDRDYDRDRDDHHDDGYNDAVRTVTCSSDDMHRHTCDVGPNGGIRLVRQRSSSRCDFNRSYGFSGSQIWVDRGCRADFEVTPSGHRPHRQ